MGIYFNSYDTSRERERETHNDSTRTLRVMGDLGGWVGGGGSWFYEATGSQC